MLPAARRLRSEKDILATIRQGRVLSTSWVRIHAKSSSAAYSRIACIVGRKVDQSAVVRHHYQRWLRVLAGEALGDIFKDQAYDMVWIALPAIKNATTLEAIRAKIWPQLKQLRHESQ
ncbi:MAG: ribonuclease P protein component [Candidatus Andersenbacteria bacterium]